MRIVLPRKSPRSATISGVVFKDYPMKKLMYFILTGIFSCQTEQKPDEISNPYQAEEKIWTVYEGRVPLDEKRNLYIELSMLPTDQTGEGHYQLKEYTEADTYTGVGSFKGKYSTLYGETPEELVIQFHNSAQEKGVTRAYSVRGSAGDFKNSQIKMIREELFRTTDLVVKVQDGNKLVVLDQRMKPLTLEPDLNLTKRTSKLFTVEGYFRHNGDTADFAEMNTKEIWAVSKQGDYRKAIRQYHQLTTEKFEVTYMKAIGYSIRHTDKAGREIDALVLKKVLQMTGSPVRLEENSEPVP